MYKKITVIKIEVKSIALKTPFITALRRVESIEFVRVKIQCSEGIFSFGEAPATKAITGEDIESISSGAEKLKQIFMSMEVGDALRLLHTQKIGSSLKAMFDMAFVSLIKPFVLESSVSIESDITISLNTPEKMLHDAKSAFKQEMRLLKVKLGSDIEHAIAVTELLSTELPHARLLIDANQAWSYEESLHYLQTVKDLPLALVEQPVVAKDLDSLKKLRDYSSVPILADEAVFTLADVVTVVEGGMADMINIKLMKCGGVSGAIEILEYARAKSVPCMLGSMLEGPYSINAALYLAFNYRDVIKYVDLDSPLLYKNPSMELDFTFDGAVITPKNVYSSQSSNSPL